MWLGSGEKRNVTLRKSSRSSLLHAEPPGWRGKGRGCVNVPLAFWSLVQLLSLSNDELKSVLKGSFSRSVYHVAIGSHGGLPGQHALSLTRPRDLITFTLF